MNRREWATAWLRGLPFRTRRRLDRWRRILHTLPTRVYLRGIIARNRVEIGFHKLRMVYIDWQLRRLERERARMESQIILEEGENDA